MAEVDAVPLQAGSRERSLKAEVNSLTEQVTDLHSQVQTLTESLEAAALKVKEAEALAAMYQKEVEAAQRRAEESWEKGFDRGFQKGRES
mmetsp:Transcript_9800/g.21322  ORF Transcript_9800/g.21322 Transcript_9800/m.21322 type:complete len:90 (-) Transcript_9800:206-475(-)